MMISICFIATLRHFCKPTWAVGQIPDATFPIVSRLSALAKLWHYLMSITTFILTFFLSQAYGLWRGMYTTTRKIQGRINDIGLLVASTVERDDQGRYTKRGGKLSWMILGTTLACFTSSVGQSTPRNLRSCNLLEG